MTKPKGQAVGSIPGLQLRAPTPPTPADFWRDAYQLAKDIHEIEVRVLQGRIDDLLSRGHQIPGPRPDEEEGPGGGKDENPLRKSNPVQWILDSVEEEIPLSNQNARENLKKWVERQVRLRGQGSLDEILAAALAGDVSEDGEEE